jgi:hypothetical protein
MEWVAEGYIPKGSINGEEGHRNIYINHQIIQYIICECYTCNIETGTYFYSIKRNNKCYKWVT